MINPICDLCGSEQHRLVYDLKSYRILRCSACGLVYRFPMPSDQEIYELYNVDRLVSQEMHERYYKDFRRNTWARMFQALDQIRPGVVTEGPGCWC